MELRLKLKDAFARHRATTWVAAAALLYTVLALLFSVSVWVDPTNVIYGHGGDEQLTMSFFALVQHAIGTLHNPFFTTYLNAPHGVNLAWETTSPLLAVVAWPFDRLFGPLVGFNLLCTAAFALTGLSTYVALARLVHSRPAAMVGGLLFAFSPFMDVHGSLGQLELSFLVTPPLLALVVHSMLCGDGRHWVRHGVLLATVLVAQFYISFEVLFIEVVAAAVAIVVAVLIDGGVRARILPVARSICLAAIISLACTAFALYVLFTYPYRPVGTIQPSSSFTTDALNLVAPTFLQRIGFPESSTVTSGFDTGDLAEATGYIGVPMILIALFAVVRLRRNRVATIAVITGALALIASLGGHLHVAGHALGFPLPWAPFLHLPIVGDLLPARFSLVVAFVLALLAAALLADTWRNGRTGLRITVTAAVLLALISYAPARLDTSVPPQPAFFTADAVRIPAGSTILLAPLPFDFSWDAELWQADAGVRFRILGGYIHGSERDHPATIPTVAAVMQSIELGKPASTDPGAIASMRQELVNSGVHTLVLGPTPWHTALHALLADICGHDGVSDQGVEVWWSC